MIMNYNILSFGLALFYATTDILLDMGGIVTSLFNRVAIHFDNSDN